MNRGVSIAPYHYNVVTVGVEFSVNAPCTDVYTHNTQPKRAVDMHDLPGRLEVSLARHTLAPPPAFARVTSDAQLTPDAPPTAEGNVDQSTLLFDVSVTCRTTVTLSVRKGRRVQQKETWERVGTA